MFFRAAPRVLGRGGVLTRRIWEGLMSTGLELALALASGFGGWGRGRGEQRTRAACECVPGHTCRMVVGEGGKAGGNAQPSQEC